MVWCGVVFGCCERMAGVGRRMVVGVVGDGLCSRHLQIDFGFEQPN